MSTKGRLAQWVFGHVEFGEDEELDAFRFRFLAIILLSGAVFTAIFVLGELTRINPIASAHVRSMSVFTVMALMLWVLLRGHKQRFWTIAWAYELTCLLEYTSALVFVPEDELRVLWFMTNVPGVYILLGQKAGAVIAVITITGLGLANSHLSAPYSPNAMATLLVSLAYVAIFFHVYADRSLSYFLRMQRSNRELRYMASHDLLTGVLNARAYYTQCDQRIHLATRHKEPYAVLFVDLDHFKSINDTHGHAAGDIVLKSVAQALKGRLRKSDLVGRIGGEEFCVFLPGTEVQSALALAEDLRKTVETLMPDIGTTHLRVTASIGVAQSQSCTQCMQEIQQKADQAMYLAKSRGRNRVSSFEEIGPGLIPA
jgi:diguanylate cyclase (GGDEF)-like protein